MPVRTHNLGFPRIGKKRELKKAVEAFWNGQLTPAALAACGRKLQLDNWQLQKNAGIDILPSNDFSFYDHMLDMACLLGVLPERFARHDADDLTSYFALARGQEPGPQALAPLEMTKWFDSNYHYLVPELTINQEFRVATTKPFQEFRLALGAGAKTKPVLIGPLTFLMLSKNRLWSEARDNLKLLPAIIPAYIGILQHLQSIGAEWVQMDEPILVTAPDRVILNAMVSVYKEIKANAPGIKIMLAAYFGALDTSLESAMASGVDALHVDLVRGRRDLDLIMDKFPHEMMLSAGVVDGRNVWKNDFNATLEFLRPLHGKLGDDRLLLAPSCSLLHCPITLAQEDKIDKEVHSWLAFAQEKLAEVTLLARALDQPEKVKAELAANKQLLEQRRHSQSSQRKHVQERCQNITSADTTRAEPRQERWRLQQERFNLPLFPTTTIGSFPQTENVRKQRAALKCGQLSQQAYDEFLRQEMQKTIRLQEEIGLDVLVHGEHERADMVEYFAAQLCGFALTEHAWVQSFGTRYVKPPIIYGDVERTKPLSTDWTILAQSLTQRPVKGMLTGPVTMLQWSFVRDDQPRKQTCQQIALAIRDEVMELERLGIGIIQIDEPALREGVPLVSYERKDYLDWAIHCFRLAASAVAGSTQIHTHMCYSQFNEIIESIDALDADVISIEAARSHMDLLGSFKTFRYPGQIGPGIWDVHSPRVPTIEEMLSLLKKASLVIPHAALWVNPDCGLKTRSWAEVTAALTNMVAAARGMREHALSPASGSQAALLSSAGDDGESD